jgi:aryl sulfotransferase
VSGIVWLASYPKSGNTWVRMILTNYLSNKNEPAHINHLYGGAEAGYRGLFDEVVELPSSDLTREEIEAYRPQLYARLAAESDDILFIKIHDACIRTNAGQLLVSDTTKAALYIVRNPFDTAISFSYHLNVSIDQIIENMADETFSIGEKSDGLLNHLRLKLLSWSGHVRSWLDQNAFPAFLMRYEDMHSNPDQTFGDALRFAGLNIDNDRLNRAIQFSKFSALQEQERTDGFKERWRYSSGAFFRKGEAGAWRSILTRAQVNRIIESHSIIMTRLGYLSASGEILC